jgi:hypothetical protein
MLSPNCLICWFPDEKRAAKVRDILDELFLDLVQTHGYDFAQPTRKMVTIGKKLGFEWTDGIDLGVDEVPDTICHADIIVVFHELCGGFPQSFITLCEAKGATKVVTHATPPVVKVKGKLLGGNRGEELTAKLKNYLTTPDGLESPWQWRRTPWGGTALKGTSPDDATFAVKGQVVEFSIPIHPVFLNGVKRFMAKGTKDFSLTFAG